MARKPKTNRVPKTRAGGEWTEAAFWGFLRSALRQASRRWPPIVRHVWQEDGVRRDSQSENKRLKYEYWCSCCGEWFPKKEIQVEHIEPCGKCSSWEEFRDFGERLFVEADRLRLYCRKCNQAMALKEKQEREAH